MGGRWSLVQIQSPRPFSSAWPPARAPGLPDPAPPVVRPARQPRGGTDMIAWVGYRMADLVGRVLPAPLVERLFGRLRRAWGVAVLPAEAPGGAAARALRRGEWVAVMADRPGLGLGERAAGRRARTACGFAATLARRTGALVLPAVMVHLPARPP